MYAGEHRRPLTRNDTVFRGRDRSVGACRSSSVPRRPLPPVVRPDSGPMGFRESFGCPCGVAVINDCEGRRPFGSITLLQTWETIDSSQGNPCLECP